MPDWRWHAKAALLALVAPVLLAIYLKVFYGV